MKRIVQLFTGLVVMLLGFAAHAQDSSLLWKITGKGLTKPSYLFGTIHIICKSDYIWTPAMKTSFEKTEKVCFEIDLSDMSAIQQEMGLMIDMNKNLSEYFTPAQYEKLKAYTKDSLDIDKDVLAHMRLSAVMLLLSSKQTDAVCTAPLSYEQEIMTLAKPKKKEITGLETMAEQFDALNSIPTDSMVKFIMESIEDSGTDDGAVEYRKLVNAYKHQDIAGLQNILAASEGLSGSLDGLLDDRNKKWISRMEGMMRGNSVFFAVGAGHLAGNNGVINLLKKEGYTVSAVK